MVRVKLRKMQCVKSAKNKKYGPYRLCYLPRSYVRPVPDAVIKVMCVTADGWSYYPKYVEQFTEI
jgi:uncharacterized protein YjhX (UPF0386 family)